MPLVWRATTSRSTSSASGLPRVWTMRMLRRPFRSGGVTRIWRSKRPGRSSAGSSFSSRLEAAITTTLSLPPKPSSSTSSWLSVWSFSPEMSLPRVDPTASSSSMNTIAGAALRAWRNSRRMRAAPRPANISTNEEADWAKKRALDSFATAFASSVLPVPGGPCRRMPFGTLAPSLREALRVAHELHHLAQLVLRLLDPLHVLPAHGARRGRRDLLRLRPRHVADHPDDRHGDQAHEDDRQPGEHPGLHVVPERGAGGALDGHVGVEPERVGAVGSRDRAACRRRASSPRGGRCRARAAPRAAGRSPRRTSSPRCRAP